MSSGVYKMSVMNMYRQTWKRFVVARLLVDSWGQRQWLWQTTCWNQAVLYSFGWLPGVQVPEGDMRDVLTTCDIDAKQQRSVKHCFRDVSATKGCFLTSRVVSNLFCQGRTVQDRDPLSGRAAWCNIVAVQSVSATVCKYFLEYNCTILRINSLSLSLFSTSL